MTKCMEVPPRHFKIELPYVLAISFLDIYLKEIKSLYEREKIYSLYSKEGIRIFKSNKQMLGIRLSVPILKCILVMEWKVWIFLDKLIDTVLDKYSGSINTQKLVTNFNI